jgi:hypothetical protein
MTGILAAFSRGRQKKDPIRESSALTTIYLLEQNQKFEQFMRQKMDELDSRVAAQQARLSTREETEERELWAALESFEEIDALSGAVGAADEGQTATDAELDVADETPLAPHVEVSEPAVMEAPEPTPDYLTLMAGGPSPTEVDVPVNELAEYPPLGLVEAETNANTVSEPAGAAEEPLENAPIGQEDAPPPENIFEEAGEIVPLVEARSFGAPGAGKTEDTLSKIGDNALEMPTVNVAAGDELATPNNPEAEYVAADVISLANEDIYRQPGSDAQQTSAQVDAETKASQAPERVLSAGTGKARAEPETAAWDNLLSDGKKADWT